MIRVYLDNAATTPIHPEVIEVILESLKNNYGNPSSTHSHGRESKGQLEGARRTIAKLINVKPSEITFTSCGTESNNTVLKNAIDELGVGRLLTTKVEHPSIKNTVGCIENKVNVEYIPLDNKGSVDLVALEKLLAESDKKTLVSVMHANNEMGAINDIDAIAEITKKHNALFHSDMVQTMGHMPIDFEKTKVDFASASAHKFHGPKGVGFLYVRSPIKLNSYISGGSQERGLRSGTENLASIVGMAKALELSTQNIEKDIANLNELRSYMRDELKKIIPNIEFLTPDNTSLSTILSVVFPEDYSHDMFLFELDMKGVSCSGGSACSSGSVKRSHVLEALNIPENKKVVRFSFSKFNTKEEIDYAIQKIQEIKQDAAKQS